MKIKIEIWEEDGAWCVHVPALPGCNTWGETYDHAIEMAKEAIQGWLEVANEREIKQNLNSKIVELAL